MDTALRILQYGTSGGFFVLGLIALSNWIRNRDRSHAYLALAVGCLGITSLLGQINALSGYRQSWIPPISLVAFLLSGYGLILFRHAFLPMSKRALGIVAAVLVILGVADIMSSPPSAPGSAYTGSQMIIVLAIIAAWCACVGEPAVRLWKASHGLPCVQRARLRALSGGYAGIVFVLVVAIAGALASPSRDAAVVQLAVEILALCTIPLLYFGFAPPRWLRRIWHEREEHLYRESLRDLLGNAPDRRVMAARALDWAIRLVGGQSGVIADADGTVLATKGVDSELAVRLAAASEPKRGSRLTRLPSWPEQLTIVQPLPLGAGTGVLLVLAGPFTPLFGTDECAWLTHYAAFVTTALDRVRLREQLADAREEAEAANAAKTAYLSRMSHELRTPLTAILGFADLLEMEDPRDDQRERIDAILRAGSHLLSLVNDVLDIARVESGHEVMSHEPVLLDDVVSESVELMAPRAARRSVTIETDTADVAGVYLTSDRQRLRQVLLNLMSNAVKYNRRGGSVRVSAHAVDADRVRVAVTDTGRGIPTEQISLLFQPFERLGAERGSTEGTGLGLALSKRLVEAMGGVVGVESESGKGSTFWLELSRTAPEVIEHPEDEAPEWSIGTEDGQRVTRTVLYVEDNLATVELVEGIFDRRPAFKLITAMQGGLGIELAREHKPDLILLDLHLPDINGDEVLRQLKDNQQTKTIPVVMLSADATERQVKRLLTAGASAYLTKPIRVRDILKVLDEALGPAADSAPRWSEEVGVPARAPSTKATAAMQQG